MTSSFCLHLLGTGNAAGIPQSGCTCHICDQARHKPILAKAHPQYLIEYQGNFIALEAGDFFLSHLIETHKIDTILLSHFDDDHIWGLGKLRWNKTTPIQLHSPKNEEKQSAFQKANSAVRFLETSAFQTFSVHHLQVTALPLQHGKPCLGWSIKNQHHHLVYLSDTCGLPQETLHWLQKNTPDLVLIDAGETPENRHYSHNSIPEAMDLLAQINAPENRLIHLGCEGIEWLEQHPIQAKNCSPAYDGERIYLN